MPAEAAQKYKGNDRPSLASSWSSNESLFAPSEAKNVSDKVEFQIKNFRHRHITKKNQHNVIADDSPRLPTSPELNFGHLMRNDEERRSLAQTPLLDREQFLFEINPADRGFASRAIEQFGLDTVRTYQLHNEEDQPDLLIKMANVYAKNWAERKLGLEQILTKLRTKQGISNEKTALELTLPIVKKALQDLLFQALWN